MKITKKKSNKKKKYNIKKGGSGRKSSRRRPPIFYNENGRSRTTNVLPKNVQNVKNDILPLFRGLHPLGLESEFELPVNRNPLIYRKSFLIFILFIVLGYDEDNRDVINQIIEKYPEYCGMCANCIRLILDIPGNTEHNLGCSLPSMEKDLFAEIVYRIDEFKDFCQQVCQTKDVSVLRNLTNSPYVCQSPKKICALLCFNRLFPDNNYHVGSSTITHLRDITLSHYGEFSTFEELLSKHKPDVISCILFGFVSILTNEQFKIFKEWILADKCFGYYPENSRCGYQSNNTWNYNHDCDPQNCKHRRTNPVQGFSEILGLFKEYYSNFIDIFIELIEFDPVNNIERLLSYL